MMEYLGLWITFIVIISLILVVLIKPTVGYFIKAAIIAAALWYSLVLYFIPNNLLGWPKNSEPPNRFIVLNTWVVEPSSKGKGGIYFWGIDGDVLKKESNVSLDPQKLTERLGVYEPRGYKMPYDRSMHEKLIKALEEQKQKRGVLQWNKEAGQGRGKNLSDNRHRDIDMFKILIPQEIFTK